MAQYSQQELSRRALASGRFSEIVIVQALDTEREAPTGEILFHHIEHLLAENPVGVGVRLFQIEFANQLVDLISDLAAGASRGRIPLLHIECHGDEFRGLEFPNGSLLSWGQLSCALEILNRASRFNLVAVFSACYGAHSVGQVEAVEPAPFWFMVAPTALADPGEVMRGMREFYNALIKTLDLGHAASALNACNLEHGIWYPVPAQTWFLRIVQGYLETHCTEDAAMRRVAEVLHRHAMLGKHVGPGRMRRIMREQNRTSFTGRYFDVFFMVDDVPENADRFRDVKRDVEALLHSLRKGGRHVL